MSGWKSFAGSAGSSGATKSDSSKLGMVAGLVMGAEGNFLKRCAFDADRAGNHGFVRVQDQDSIIEILSLLAIAECWSSVNGLPMSRSAP